MSKCDAAFEKWCNTPTNEDAKEDYRFHVAWTACWHYQVDPRDLIIEKLMDGQQFDVCYSCNGVWRNEKKPKECHLCGEETLRVIGLQNTTLSEVEEMRKNEKNN